MLRPNTKRRAFVCALFVTLLTACGGGDSGGNTGGGSGSSSGGGSGTTFDPPIADLTGDWNVTEGGTSDCPGEATYTSQYRVSVSQDRNSLTVVAPAGTFSGTISGSSLSWKGSYQEDGGTTEITSMSLTVAADAAHFSGSANWKWSNGAINCTGRSQAINGERVASAPTPPPVPSGVTATAQSAASILVQWSSASQPGSGFRIERRNTGRGAFEEIGVAATSATSYLDQGLGASTNYSYRVRSYDGDKYSEYSEAASATTSAAPDNLPADPSQLRAEEATISSLTLYWLDNASNEIGYQVERSSSANAGFALIHTAAAGAVSHIDTGLASATTYFYRVRAVGSAGTSGYSNIASTGTLAAPTAPAFPTGAQATALGSTSVRLQWQDNSADETGFKIERSVRPTTGFDQIAVTRPDANSFDDARLSSSTTYYYRVRATRSDGTAELDSEYSNVATVTTPVPPPATVVLVPAIDTLLLVSSTNSSVQDTTYANKENAVGCNWAYSPVTAIQDYVCAASAIYFEVPADERTIRSATLRLYPRLLPADFQSTLELRAIANTWNPASMTWRWFERNGRTWTSPLVHAAPPTSTRLPLDLDVTAIVRNWTSGTWPNYGLFLANVEVDYRFPSATAYRAMAFDSLEFNLGADRRPQLTIEYE